MSACATKYSSRFVPVSTSQFDIVLGVQAKALALFLGHGALHFGGHAHHHAQWRNHGALRHHGAGGNYRSSPYFRPVEQHRADSDQAIIFHRASMQHDQVSGRYAITDVERKPARVAMQDRIVLNVTVITDTNFIHVAASRGIGPDAGAFADHHVSNHLRALIDVSGSGDLGYDAAIGTNHDCGLNLNRSTLPAVAGHRLLVAGAWWKRTCSTCRDSLRSLRRCAKRSTSHFKKTKP